MQTFLPYSDFQKSAQCLDYRRLGKQRVETLQIMNALVGLSNGWSNHPATLMWAGYEKSLLDYQYAIVGEWINRGYRDNVCMDKTIFAFSTISKETKNEKWSDPWWLGEENLHLSHRSNLLRKDFNHYCQFGWIVDDDLEYWWPTKEESSCQIKVLEINTSL